MKFNNEFYYYFINVVPLLNHIPFLWYCNFVQTPNIKIINLDRK